MKNGKKNLNRHFTNKMTSHINTWKLASKSYGEWNNITIIAKRLGENVG
jgi:hypothetical protein